jgi:hypothetical protein
MRKTGRTHKRKRKLRFAGKLLIYIMVLLTAGGLILFHVLHDMHEIESNIPAKFIASRMGQLREDQISQLFESNPVYEPGEDLKQNVASFFKEGQYDVHKSGENLYTVTVNGKDVLEAGLYPEKTVNKLGLLTYEIYSLKSLTALSPEKSLASYTISVPDGYRVTINGVEAQNPVETKLEKFADAYDYADLPSSKTYVISNLTRVPDIVITHNGENVEYEEKDGQITIEDQAESYDSLEAAGMSDFDALGFAENWSLFMSDDLQGASHGLDIVTADMIPDSQMYNKAVEWANGVDITFTSVHTLDDPPFSKEEVLGVQKYGDNGAAVEVSLDKPMHIDNGVEKTDTFHSILYVVKVQGEWKVVNIAGA